MTENILTSSPFSIEERKKIFDQNYSDIKRRVEAAALKSGRTFKDINILAATKTIDVQVINYAINSGIMLIGENRVQEFLSKEDSLETNAERHFIGHLQSNKAKDIVGKVSLIHSVHSVKLAKVISDISLKKGIVTEILLEVNIGNEDSKSGFSKYEVVNAVTEISKLEGVFVKGLMAIPPICENSEKNRPYFKEMCNLFLDIRGKKIDNSSMDILSMGMSDDFDVAIEEGANMVRIGTSLFGKRFYNI
ncbi:MAG: YggS family pyridoxal phosphate-dependent enzyme [Clostridia bacterium]|nr:YggS family pyridoxal phosphate-dependent enzyme [Clostridia bacterium]